MQCPNCGKTGFLNIGGKRYCSNCGASVAGQAPRAMSDIKPAAPASAAPAPATVVSPAQPSAPVKPAGQFHGTQVGAGAAVLDLRASQPAPNTIVAPAPKPVAPTEPPKPAPESITQPVTEAPQPDPAPAPAPIITPSYAEKAAPEPPQVATPPKPVVSPEIVKPKADPAASLMPTQPSTPAAAQIQRFPGHQPSADMPNAVDTQVNKLKTLALPEGDTTPKSPGLQEVLANAKPVQNASITKIGAALASIAVISTIVWMQNSPKLAFTEAASKAGISATLPTYVPSSYKQDGPVTVSEGQVALNFKSPSSDSPLKIAQKRTGWDSNSLRENYVTHQSDNFVAVQGQGLTIYLYSDQANWVNHGIWYSVSGTAKLSREQILKIAYGL